MYIYTQIYISVITRKWVMNLRGGMGEKGRNDVIIY